MSAQRLASLIDVNSRTAAAKRPKLYRKVLRLLRTFGRKRDLDAERSKAIDTPTTQASGATLVQVAERPVQPKVSTGYSIVNKANVKETADDAWHYDDVVAQQHAAYQSLLADIEKGRIREDFMAAARAIDKTNLDFMSLLEVGCGSGYYFEVFQRLVAGRVDYTGMDYSSSMIRVAGANYGKNRFIVANACSLPFHDASFDVVMNGVSLMHIANYEQAIRESRRVANRFAIFHTTSVTETGNTTFLEKNAYGRRVLEIVLNECEFLTLAKREGLALVDRLDSIPYDLFDQIGTHTYARTYVFVVTQNCGSVEGLS